jgi:hypothetical protein
MKFDKPVFDFWGWYGISVMRDSETRVQTPRFLAADRATFH